MCSSCLERNTPAGCVLGGWLLMCSSRLKGEHAQWLRTRRMASDVFYLSNSFKNRHSQFVIVVGVVAVIVLVIVETIVVLGIIVDVIIVIKVLISGAIVLLICWGPLLG